MSSIGTYVGPSIDMQDVTFSVLSTSNGFAPSLTYYQFLMKKP